jgi:excisionase family DNA binding protein
MREIRLGWKTIKQYTLQEVMEKLEISKVTALKLVQTGELKAVKIARRYWINEEDLIVFLEGKS